MVNMTEDNFKSIEKKVTLQLESPLVYLLEAVDEYEVWVEQRLGGIIRSEIKRFIDDSLSEFGMGGAEQQI